MTKMQGLQAIRNGIAVCVAMCAMINLHAQAKASQAKGGAHNSYFTYVGTYTGPNSKGIYGFRHSPADGSLTPMGVVAEVEQPSFVVTDPRNRFLYAVTEIGSGGKGEGSVSSFAIDAKTGALTFLNKVPSLGGGPCHMVVDKTGKMLFVANYGTGSVVAFAIKPDGSIGEKTGFEQLSGSSVDTRRQKGPHAHEVVLSSDNRFLFVPDLGTDHIMIYKVDAAKRTFTPNDPAFASVKPGLGPRHFAFGPGDKFGYLLCEMGSSVVVFSYNKATGELIPVQTISNLPPDFKGEDNSAEIQISSSGRFVYASNRGHDSITVYAADPVKGTLSQEQIIPSGGKIPRNFVIDPSGKYLIVANQKSDNMVIFTIDPKTGKLSPTGTEVSAPSPVSIQFVPAS